MPEQESRATHHPAIRGGEVADVRYWMKRFLVDRRYGCVDHQYALAKAFGCMRAANFRRKQDGREWIYPTEMVRFREAIRKIREGRLRPKCTREWNGRKIYDPVVMDPPVYVQPDMDLRVRVDFRGVKVGIIPAAPPARQMPSPEGVFQRAKFWKPGMWRK